jgi:hypothetical protein
MTLLLHLDPWATSITLQVKTFRQLQPPMRIHGVDRFCQSDKVSEFCAQIQNLHECKFGCIGC